MRRREEEIRRAKEEEAGIRAGGGACRFEARSSAEEEHKRREEEDELRALEILEEEERKRREKEETETRSRLAKQERLLKRPRDTAYDDVNRVYKILGAIYLFMLPVIAIWYIFFERPDQTRQRVRVLEERVARAERMRGAALTEADRVRDALRGAEARRLEAMEAEAACRRALAEQSAGTDAASVTRSASSTRRPSGARQPGGSRTSGGNSGDFTNHGL